MTRLDVGRDPGQEGVAAARRGRRARRSTRMDEALRGWTVRVALPKDLPLVPVDEVLIEQVLINLLENAAKYASAGTAIEIAAHADGSSVVVEVMDRGPGFPPRPPRQDLREVLPPAARARRGRRRARARDLQRRRRGARRAHLGAEPRGRRRDLPLHVARSKARRRRADGGGTGRERRASHPAHRGRAADARASCARRSRRRRRRAPSSSRR